MKLTTKSAVTTKRVLVYGASKTGKSLLVGKLAEKYNLIWFDNEQGWSVLNQLPEEWKERINIISVPDSRVYPIAVETWLKVIKGAKTSICAAHGKVDCAICKKDSLPFDTVELNTTPRDTIVVFDSLTQLTNSVISHITKAQPDDYKLQLDDYGNLKFLIDKFLSQIQAANYNIVCITHEEMTVMEDKKLKIVPSSGSSKSSAFTAKYFDEVVYAELVNKKHRFGSGTDYSMTALTGSRSNVRLEDSKGEVSLLTMFAPMETAIGITALTNTTSSNTNITSSPSITVPSNNNSTAALTPAQIALANLRKLKT